MHQERQAHLLTLVLFSSVALLYGALWFAGFVWDDAFLIQQNRITGDLANVHRFFSEDLWESTGAVGDASGYYRPLMLLSLAVDRSLWDLSAAGHHMHSVAWHLAASGFLLALLRKLVPPIPAVLGTAVFALHPVQSEAVAWVSSRNDPMVATFVLASVLVLLPRRCSVSRLFLGGVLVLAATLSKESGVLAPVLLLLLDLARWRRPGGMGRYGAAALGIAVWFALRQAAGVHLSQLPEPAGVALLWERGHQVVGTYGRLLVFPWPLSTGRTLEHLNDSPWQIAAGLFSLLALAGFQVGRGKWLGLGGLLFALLAVAPSMVALAGKGQLGERYLYLPMVGLALGIAAALPATGRALWVAAPIGLCWGFVLQHRLPEWQNALGLWEAAARDTPNGYAFTGYGHELRRAGDSEQAQKYFLMAVDDPPPQIDACANVLRGPLSEGRVDEALSAARYLKGKGCSATPAFMGILATVFARSCLWDEVRLILPKVQGDIGERDLVFGGALALIDGESDEFQRLLGTSSDSASEFRRRVRLAMDQGCREDLPLPSFNSAQSPPPPR
jgi:tetratricopeptide (TPR) repeat protein